MSDAPELPEGTPVRGTLSVVATPLGNLGDVTRRAHEVLREADLVAAEDTRRTGQLLAFLGLQKAQVACHKFSEARVLEGLLAELALGRKIALVTDGGTPAISDPGHRLVAAALAAGHRVVPVPGPSAVVAALSVAGFPADRFHFAGFLPVRPRPRREALAALAGLDTTLVFYEAPHRLLESLEDAIAVLGDRPATMCRELTKLHEEVRRGPLSEILDEMRRRPEVLGEIVLVIAGREGAGGAAAPVVADADVAREWAAALAAEDGDERRALRRMARDHGVARDEMRRRLQLEGLLRS